MSSHVGLPLVLVPGACLWWLGVAGGRAEASRARA
jgi:hypothetical protein